MRYLTTQPIDPATLADGIASAECGAVVTFVGLVRDHHAGRSVVSLSYTAFDEMAEQVCAAIVAEARARWSAQVAVAHRLGHLFVGDVAVAIAVAAPHRDAAFEACRWVIDAVKARAPIWKRERYADGTEAWVDPTAASGTVPVSR